jgi:1-acyl-sn-glycerol-3-phosphate acyltransferase
LNTSRLGLNTLRMAWRALALTVWTTGSYAWLVSGSFALALVRGGGWAGPATAAWRTGVFRCWSRASLWLIGVKLETQGPPPQPPFFLVSNHLSYLDILVIASQARCVFVAKADVAGWPIFGTLCRAADTMFIDRGNKRDIPRVIEQIRGVLSGGRGVVVFPEGSSTKGEGVQRFKPSLLESAASARLPVAYATISYRTPAHATPAHLSVCWWGEMTFGSHLLDMLGLPEIRATLSFGDERILESDRKALAERLQCAVARQFQPVV